MTARGAAARFGERLGDLSRSPRYVRALSWWPLAPVVAILAYAVVLAMRVPSLVHDTATSDSVGPMVVAQSLSSPHAGSSIVLGNAAHYTTLWFDEVTRGLPGHRAIWQAMPYVLSLLGVAMLAETVRRLTNWRSALVALAIALATPPLVLLPMLAQAFHSTTVVNGIVLAALLVWLARTPSVTATHVVAGGAALAVLTGLDVASDPLLLVAGVAPFAAAAVLLAVRRRDARGGQLLAACTVFTALALVVAGLTTVAMHRAGYSVEGLPLRVASPGTVRSNISLLGHLVLAMGNGRLSLHDLGFLGPLRILLGVLAIAAVAVPLWFLVCMLRGGSGPAASTPAPEDGDRDDATTLFLSYWGFVAGFLAIAFVFTTLPVDRASMRYLVPGFMAIAATVPFLTVRIRGSLAAGVALAVLANGVLGALILHRATLDDFDVQDQHAAGLVAALESHGLTHGYAGYWQANLLTWESDGRITSRAVQQSDACGATAPGWFCPYPIFTISSWYSQPPQPGPSFLIREVGGSFVPSPPPSELRPTGVFSYDRFEIYVYDHDIGADATLHAAGWSGG